MGFPLFLTQHDRLTKDLKLHKPFAAKSVNYGHEGSVLGWVDGGAEWHDMGLPLNGVA